ncbi:MAG: sulfurtransferase TusA family protein [Anaerolineae bacterium]|nr:sulfurtransferase TusA family protein [Anaerolineae bacterium]
MMSKRIDLRGEICPYPMMKTVQALKKLGKEERELVVVIDHAPALETIPTQAERLGFSVEIKETGSPEWQITLTRK